MMRVTFRPPTESDLDRLAERMREMDRRECELVAGLPPREALAECVEGSEGSAVLAEVDGEPVCVFGVTEASMLGGDGYPWMLCAEGVEAHARTLLTVAPRFLGEMRARYEHLSNVVHAHNRSAIRFIRWAGFKLGETLQVKGEPFVCFEWNVSEGG